MSARLCGAGEMLEMCALLMKIRPQLYTMCGCTLQMCDNGTLVERAHSARFKLPQVGRRGIELGKM